MTSFHLVIVIILILSLLFHLYFYTNETVHGKKLDKQTGKLKKLDYHDYVNSVHGGLIRGLIIGICLGDGGITSAVTNAAVFGIVNPCLMHLGY